MNSEKVKAIKKDIDFCTTKIGCEGCSFMPIMASTNCRNELLKNCLILINELEGENERLRLGLPKTKARIVAPIYVMPNVETPEMMLKLGEKNLLQQFAERLKEKMGVREYMGVKYKQGVFSENDIDETLKEFLL